MAAPATLAFVAAPAVTPTVTLNLDQPGLVKVKADSFSLGAPEFEGDPMTGFAYGERTVEFTLQVSGTYEEAATLIQSVMRQLTQGAAGSGARNWLMFRWSGSQPFFGRTFRSSLNPLDWRMAGVGVWEFPVSIVCDGFVYGAPEDIASFAISLNPSSGTNRVVAGPGVLGAVKGDVDTPLILATTAGVGFNTTSAGPAYLASYALSGQTHTLLARNLTELTSFADTGATVSAAGTNYIDGDYKECTFATQSMATRLSGAFSTALTPMPGLYRILMRAVESAAGATATIDWQFQLSISKLTGVLTGDVVTTGPHTVLALAGILVDFGVWQMPVASPSTGAVGMEAAPTAVGTAPVFTIDAAMNLVSGSATTKTIRFDELYLIPLDTMYGDGSLFVSDNIRTTSSSSDSVLFDGVNETLRFVRDTGSGFLTGAPRTGDTGDWVGAMPMLRPGANNYIHWIAEIPTLASAPNNSTTFVGRYYPRYVHVKPSAT